MAHHFGFLIVVGFSFLESSGCDPRESVFAMIPPTGRSLPVCLMILRRGHFAGRRPFTLAANALFTNLLCI